MANGNGGSYAAWAAIVITAAGALIGYGETRGDQNALVTRVETIEKNQAEDTRTSVTERLKVKTLETRQATIADDVKEVKDDLKEFKKETNDKLDKILEKLSEQD